MTGKPAHDGWPFAMSQQVAAEQLDTKLGIEIVEWDPKRLVATMPVSGNRQPYGLLHGGANSALVESLGSICAWLNAPEGRVPVGLELSCTHHRAALDGVVTGVAIPVHLGHSTATIEVVITDEQSKRTCTGKLTCLFRERPPA